jgi:hypothetical protein
MSRRPPDTIDAAHAHDQHEQQADTYRRQRKAAEVVPNVLESQVHRWIARPSVSLLLSPSAAVMTA